MKRYYGHTLHSLCKALALGRGRSASFTEMFTGAYQPMMRVLGARWKPRSPGGPLRLLEKAVGNAQVRAR
ncbi:hypothetical protein ACOJVU_04485 [Mycobacterium sp. THU-M104]|uniref:hypothetical protein n=1 Tax=Mycobacterium sp. THU-M104 TaxID=3410515 RepID=UPI003B9B5154